MGGSVPGVYDQRYRGDEVQEVIGKENLKVIRKAIKDGKVKLETIRTIARRMGGSVPGVYDQKYRDREAPVDIFNYMMDRWYKEVLFEPGVEAVKKLVDILKDEDVGENSLALKMTLKSAALNIGLPDTHFKIQLENLSKAGSLPYPSNQGQTYTCSSHAVGKAVLDILDSAGWDAEQEQIIQAVKAKLQPGGSRENPDQCDGVKIKVNVKNKEDPRKCGDINLEVGVQGFLSNVPVADDLVANRVRMVIRWKMWNCNLNNYDPHAIYAKEFNKATETFSCINSWNNNLGYPEIHKAEVQAIYYITIRQV